MRNDQGRHIYFSELVPGYAEKHTLRGVRERNAALLRSLRESAGADAVRRVKDSLAENNRPLARFVAEKWARALGWTRDETDDAYQECCYALVKYLHDTPGDKLREISSSYLSVAMHGYMSSRMRALHADHVREREIPTVPFDEEAYVPDGDPVPDMEFLRGLIERTPLGERKKQVFLDYVFGDLRHHVAAYNTDDIAFRYGISRSTVLLDLKKAMNTFSVYARQLMRRRVYDPIDFYKQSTL